MAPSNGFDLAAALNRLRVATACRLRSGWTACLPVLAGLLLISIEAGVCSGDEPVEFLREVQSIGAGLASYQQAATTEVTAVAILPDPSWIVVGNVLGEVNLVHVDGSSSAPKRLDQSSAAIIKLAYLPDVQQMVVLDASGQLTIIGLNLANPVATEPLRIAGGVVSFATDGSQLFVLYRNQMLKWCDLDQLDQFDSATDQSLQLEFPFASISIASEGKRLLLCGPQHWQIRQLPDLQKRVQASIPQGQITASAIDHQGVLFATGLSKGIVRIRDAQTGQLLHAWNRHASPVTSLVFSSTGETLISSSLRSRFRIWNARHGEPLNDRDVGLQRIYAMSLSADDRFLAVGGNSPATFLLQARDTKPVIVADRFPETWNARAVLAVRLVDDGKRLAVLPMASTVQWVDMTTGAVTSGRPIDATAKHETKAGISHDGMYSAVIAADRTVTIYRTGAEGADRQLALEQGAESIAFAPHSNRLAIVGRGLPGWIKIVDIATGDVLLESADPQNLFRMVRWADDERSIYTLGDKIASGEQGVVLSQWSATSGQLIRAGVLTPNIHSSFTVSPQGSRVAVESGASGIIEIFDQNLESLRRFGASGIGGMHAMHFLDERKLMIGTFKGSVVMMDVETGSEQQRFQPLPPEQSPPIRSIDYSKESKILVAGGGKDGFETLRVYDLTESQKSVNAGSSIDSTNH
ncbi:WD40 repeat domain-containing protein [Stieleria sp. TO1_6]|uniref:WD40 repeat domain-containing protein n=1 Tax=Stieleria tagensis TaxID=2956795 RepID=UPI00209AF85A|nr:WD40 repeat domain-containing protein [Stieleria tagensis]MCO8122647.1 WD40 repeat domain-containing protein [Stieleria tagensis]